VERLTSSRLDVLLEEMRGIRALVVGDLILDRYLSGEVERVSPEAPVPVVRVQSSRASVGGSGNVAANITALGGIAHAVGCVGDDEAGRALADGLEDLGVLTGALVTVPGRPTTEKTRVLSLQQQIVRFDREQEDDVSTEIEDRLISQVEWLSDSADVVILEDYNKGVLTPRVINAVLAAAAERGIPSVADPKRRNFFGYRGATVFKPNRKEVADALGAFVHPDDAEWMQETRTRLGCEHLLLTLGGDGISMKGPDGFVRIPALARSVYDVSGAGDTVTAIVALVLAAGGTATEAALLANEAAAIEVGKAGVATVSGAELRKHLHDS